MLKRGCLDTQTQRGGSTALYPGASESQLRIAPSTACRGSKNHELGPETPNSTRRDRNPSDAGMSRRLHSALRKIQDPAMELNPALGKEELRKDHFSLNEPATPAQRVIQQYGRGEERRE